MERRVDRTAVGYRVAFAIEGDAPFLILDLDQLERVPWGLLATLRVTMDVGLPLDEYVLIERLNLLKSSDKEKVAAQLATLADVPGAQKHDWKGYLDAAVVAIDKEQRTPVAHINDAHLRGRSTTPRFLIVGLLARDMSNILYGAGGTGKSALAMRIAGGVYHGGAFFGHQIMATGHSLYLDWEGEVGTFSDRLDMVSRGMGLPENFPLGYRCFTGRGPYDWHHAAIKQWLMDNPETRLVIIDSTAMAMAGMSGDQAEQAIRFYSLVNELPCTVLLIDHIASEDVKSASGTAKPYGSVFKMNAARNAWEAQRSGASDLLLVHRKHNVGPRMDDIPIEVDWTDDAVTYNSPLPPPTWLHSAGTRFDG